MQIKKYIRIIRDVEIVKSILIKFLKILRKFGLFKSEKYYRHLPYKGIIRVDLIKNKSFKIMGRGAHVENSLYWEGTYGHEPETIKKWVDNAEKANVVFDIGSNSGVYSLYAAAAGAKKIYSFEPVKRVYEILNENIKLNSFESIQPCHYAISDKEGIQELYDPGGNEPTSATLSKEFGMNHLGGIYTKSYVEVISIDKFCELNLIKEVNLIKLDVEGYEEYAIKGMVKTVERNKPLIFIEVLDEYETNLKKIVEEVFKNYKWERINEGKKLKSRNVLLTPNKKNIDH